VLISRSDPPLPLSRLRARGQLREIRASELRFTPQEVDLFLNKRMGYNLSEEDTFALSQRTEGWIAGLQLAAVSMKDATDTHEFVGIYWEPSLHHRLSDRRSPSAQPETVKLFFCRHILSACVVLFVAVILSNSAKNITGQAMLEALNR
jgi:LuxR family maltose regulon positive regulatory protein